MNELNFEDLDKYLLKQNNFIIHQVWFGTIPNKKEAAKTYKKLKPYRDSWINNNPNWFYISWNLENCKKLMKNFYPQHLEMYNNYDYTIQKCDAIRYFILHRYGGLYADMDYFCNKTWTEVLEEYPNHLYLVETPNTTKFLSSGIHISNSLMYSKSNHVFWKYVFIELELNKKSPIYYSRHITIMFTTGPSILNRIFNKYKRKFRLNYYPYKKFHPYGLIDNIKTLSNNPNVYAFHMQKGAWHKKDTKILNFLYQEYSILIIILFILILPLSVYSIIFKV